MSMTVEKLDNVEAEMDRLIERIIELRSAHEAAVEKRKRTGNYEPDPLRGSQLTGAVRRSSLDLTRALAELRKW